MVTLGLFSKNHPQEDFSQIWLEVREKRFSFKKKSNPSKHNNLCSKYGEFHFFFPSKYGDFGPFFQKLSFGQVTVPFLGHHVAKIPPPPPQSFFLYLVFSA
jgi:hypothetical protein